MTRWRSVTPASKPATSNSGPDVTGNRAQLFGSIDGRPGAGERNDGGGQHGDLGRRHGNQDRLRHHPEGDRRRRPTDGMRHRHPEGDRAQATKTVATVTQKSDRPGD